MFFIFTSENGLSNEVKSESWFKPSCCKALWSSLHIPAIKLERRNLVQILRDEERGPGHSLKFEPVFNPFCMQIKMIICMLYVWVLFWSNMWLAYYHSSYNLTHVLQSLSRFPKTNTFFISVPVIPYPNQQWPSPLHSFPPPDSLPPTHTPVPHHPINTSVYIPLLTFPSPLPDRVLPLAYRVLTSHLSILTILPVFTTIFVSFSCSLWNCLPCWLRTRCLSSYLPCLQPAFEYSPLYQRCYSSWHVLSIPWCGRMK